MASPKSSSYAGWFRDKENGTLDIYYGEGGASDPVEIAQVDTSGLTIITGDLGVAAGTLDVHRCCHRCCDCYSWLRGHCRGLPGAGQHHGLGLIQCDGGQSEYRGS